MWRHVAPCPVACSWPVTRTANKASAVEAHADERVALRWPLSLASWPPGLWVAGPGRQVAGSVGLR